MKAFFVGLVLGVALTGGISPALAGAPDEPAGGTPASCAGIAFSDHATGNAASTQRQVIHEEIPALLELTGLTRAQLYQLFVRLHEETHEGCEAALLEALGLTE